MAKMTEQLFIKNNQNLPFPQFLREEKKSLPFTVSDLDIDVFKGMTRQLKWLSRAVILAKALLSYKVIMVTETSHFFEGLLFRNIKPGARLIHYCQEYVTPEEYPNLKLSSFYLHYAHFADMVIDVEPNRAKLRMDRYKLNKLPLVLANTLPMTKLPPQSPPGYLKILAGGGIPPNLPIVLYMGGVGREKAFERMVDALSQVYKPFFFLAFCDSTIARLTEVKMYLKKKLGNQGRICGPVSRDQLLRCAGEADIGIVYYPFDADPTNNQWYCAPTKFYEYMALGVPVVTSRNESLRTIVTSERIGICVENDTTEALTNAFHTLLSEEAYRQDIKSRAPLIFKKHYCYEVICSPVVNQIELQIREWHNYTDRNYASSGITK